MLNGVQGSPEMSMSTTGGLQGFWHLSHWRADEMGHCATIAKRSPKLAHRAMQGVGTRSQASR